MSMFHNCFSFFDLFDFFFFHFSWMLRVVDQLEAFSQLSGFRVFHSFPKAFICAAIFSKKKSPKSAGLSLNSRRIMLEFQKKLDNCRELACFAEKFSIFCHPSLRGWKKEFAWFDDPGDRPVYIVFRSSSLLIGPHKRCAGEVSWEFFGSLRSSFLAHMPSFWRIASIPTGRAFRRTRRRKRPRGDRGNRLAFCRRVCRDRTHHGERLFFGLWNAHFLVPQRLKDRFAY